MANYLADGDGGVTDPNDWTDMLNTPIPPERQAEYENWARSIGQDPNTGRRDYDLQGAFLAGAGQNGAGHLTDEFKKPNHFTFSDESNYSRDGFESDKGGQWGQDDAGNGLYRPSSGNFKFHSPGQTQKYFDQVEPDAKLMPPFGGQDDGPPPFWSPPGSTNRDPADNDVARVYGQMPEPPKTSWWQRGLGGIAGGLAGWSNAAGRTKKPIDIAGLVENIERPGYKQKLSDWQQHLKNAEGVQNAQMKGEQIRAQADWRHAQAERQRLQAQPHYGMEQIDPAWAKQNLPGRMPDANGEYWIPAADAREMQKEAQKMVVAPEGSRIFRGNEVISEGKPKPPTSEFALWQAENPNGTSADWQKFQLGNKAAPPEHLLTPVQILTEEAAHPGKHPKAEVDKAQALFNQEHRGPRDPNADKPMTRAQKITIESKHQQAYETLAKQVMTERAKGTDEGAITNYENQQKQIIENAYAAELSAATGNYIQPFSYSAAPPQGNPAGGGRGGGDKVVVISKAGVPGQIPRARLQEYLANGYKLQ